MQDNVLPTAKQNLKNNVAERARPEQNKTNEQSNTITAKNNYTETREYTKKYSIEQEKVEINRHIDNLEQILKYGNLDLLQMKKNSN